VFLDGNMSRRKFFSVSAANALALAVTSEVLAAVAQPTELSELSAVDAIAAMKRGDITAERYASTLLARCKAAQALNAFITLQPENVLEAARAADKRRRSNVKLGALHGLPIPLKDSVNTRDMPTTGGTRALRSFQPQVDAPLVTQLRDSGAILLGKTNLHEISMGYTSAI
jgi:indoleacetamide hydrolase